MMGVGVSAPRKRGMLSSFLVLVPSEVVLVVDAEDDETGCGVGLTPWTSLQGCPLIPFRVALLRLNCSRLILDVSFISPAERGPAVPVLRRLLVFRRPRCRWPVHLAVFCFLCCCYLRIQLNFLLDLLHGSPFVDTHRGPFGSFWQILLELSGSLNFPYLRRPNVRIDSAIPVV